MRALDDFLPAYEFSERHSTRIDGSAVRIDQALRSVSIADIPAARALWWLRRFGPGTTLDLTWWLGSTLTAVRQALRDVGAVEVALEGGTGWVLPDDVDPAGPVDPWVALLPGLDPTTMGWSERDWYLRPHRAQVFVDTVREIALDKGVEL